MVEISYLGPRHTFTHMAAREMAEKLAADLGEGCRLSGYYPLHNAPGSLRKGADFAVMPLENTIEGKVQKTLDVVYLNRLFAVSLHRHDIVWAVGAAGSNLGTIYSHPMAFGQCSDWIEENFPGAVQVPAGSTAGGARMAAKNGGGIAFAPIEAIREYGLGIVKLDAGNKRQGRKNCTYFYLVSAGENPPGPEKGKEYLAMVAVTPHKDEPQLLSRMLGIVRFNNTRIHQRPALDNINLGENGELQMFYIEMECHSSSPEFRGCVEELEGKLKPKGSSLEVVRLMGCYEKPLG